MKTANKEAWAFGTEDCLRAMISVPRASETEQTAVLVSSKSKTGCTDLLFTFRFHFIPVVQRSGNS